MMTIGPEFKYHRELLAACDRIRAYWEARRDTPDGRTFFAELARHEREGAARRRAEKGAKHDAA